MIPEALEDFIFINHRIIVANMRAAVYYGVQKLSVENMNDPSINDNEILIKPIVVGVCPTDVRIYYEGSSSVKPPVVLGHEVSGIVVESKNPNFVPGDRVNVAADAPCMNCRYCRKGLHNLCDDMLSIGFNVDGAYATLMRVPRRFLDDNLVFKLPNDASFEDGALIEPVAVSLNALSLVYPGNEDNIVIIGDGPNALIHLMLLRNYFKVGKITVIGLLDHRLSEALKLGADYVINLNTINRPLNELRFEIKHPIDIIDVTVGNKNSIIEAISLTEKGTRIVFFGGSHPDVELPLTLNKVHYNQLLVTGSSGTTISNYKKAYELIINGVVRPGILITHKYSLNEILTAFETAKLGKGLKVAVTP